jgi:hypothetical protein
MSKYKDRTATTRYFLLMHIVDSLPPGIDKDELRDNARRAWPDEAQIMDDVFILHQARLNASEIFSGAHVIIADGGRRYEAWTKLRTAQQRMSSHQSDKPEHAVSGPCCHTILFGTVDEHTWFQMENNSLEDWVYHLVDFIKYKATGKNQGPYGSSAHTDRNPLRIITTRRIDGQLVELD